MRSLTTALPCICALLIGCVSENGLDPTGDDFSVSAEWTVNGSAPSPESCGAAGIEQVRVAFYEGSRAHYLDELTVCCSAGSISTDPILAYARHRIELQAHDLHKGGGTTAHATDQTAYLVEPPQEHLDLTPGGPMDFVYDDGDRSGIRVTARWTVGGASPTADVCAAAGVETVRLRAYASSDTAYATPLFERSVPCSAGSYDSNGEDGDTTPLPNDAVYRTETSALDASGAVVDQDRPEIAVDASCVATLALPPADLG